jgi:hypothetical protein
MEIVSMRLELKRTMPFVIDPMKSEEGGEKKGIQENGIYRSGGWQYAGYCKST